MPVKQKCQRTALNNAWSLWVTVSYKKAGGKGPMELTPSIRFQVWIRVSIEDSSRNREKERKSDLAGDGREGENCLLKIEAKQDKCEALAMCKKLPKRGRIFLWFCFVCLFFPLCRSCLGEDVMSQTRKTQMLGNGFLGKL